MVEPAAVSYCGAPPDPQQIWARWNLDPVLIGALALLYVAYLAGARRGGADRRRRIAFTAGWLATGLALISPLCPLSVSLFAARVGQHMFLVLIAAPLVARGCPLAAWRALLPRSRRRDARRHPAYAPLASAGAFAVLLAYWHAPQPYTVTFESTGVYWLMHLTLFGSAVWLWASLLDRAALAPAAGAVGVATGAMSLIGAVLTFAPRPLYPPHALTPYAWGLTPLQDQQLGGALMWAPAGVIVVLAIVAAVARLLNDSGRPVGSRAAA